MPRDDSTRNARSGSHSDDGQVAAKLALLWNKGQYDSLEAEKLKEFLYQRIINHYSIRLKTIHSQYKGSLVTSEYESFIQYVATKLLVSDPKPGISTFKEGMPFSPWLCRVAENVLRDWIKRRANRERPESTFSTGANTNTTTRPTSLLSTIPSTKEGEGDVVSLLAEQESPLNGQFLKWIRSEVVNRSHKWKTYGVLYVLVNSKRFSLSLTAEERAFFLQTIVVPNNLLPAKNLLSHMGTRQISQTELARLMLPLDHDKKTLKTKQDYVSKACERVTEKIVKPWFAQKREEME